MPTREGLRRSLPASEVIIDVKVMEYLNKKRHQNSIPPFSRPTKWFMDDFLLKYTSLLEDN